MPFERAVIVGASLAGGRAAETLRAQGFEGRVVLIGDEPHRPYERPPLSKDVLRGEAPPEKAFLRPAEYYAENDIDLLLGARALRVDPADRSVVLDDGARVEYDRLLLATGAHARRISVPGSELEGIHTLRTIEDALRLGEALRGSPRVAVVGGGFIGCEVAASARTVGCEVTIVEMLETPLAAVLGAEVGGLVGEIHRAHGVRLRTGARVVKIDGDGRAERVVLADGDSIEADVVVVGVGVEPAQELAADAGIEAANGIVVDEHCRTSAPDVFAAGDVASHPNPILGTRIRVEHWQNAQNQGVVAARAMLGESEPHAEVPWFWSDQYDRTIQLFGHPPGRADVVVRGDASTGEFAAFYLVDDVVVGALGVNRPRDARAGRDLIKARAVVAREVLADESSDLRALARHLAG